jgi:hypothetical protein
MDDYTKGDLMAAILNLRDAMMFGFERHDKYFDVLRRDINRRFDRVDDRFDRMDERFDRMDERFDRLEDRVAAIEPHGQRPAS